MGIVNEKSRLPTTQEIRNLVREAGDDVRRLRRHLAELTEIGRLDADIPDDEQRIEMIKEVLTRWHKIASVLIREAVEGNFQTKH
jgi:hypothetical protein